MATPANARSSRPRRCGASRARGWSSRRRSSGSVRTTRGSRSSTPGSPWARCFARCSARRSSRSSCSRTVPTVSAWSGSPARRARSSARDCASRRSSGSLKRRRGASTCASRTTWRARGSPRPCSTTFASDPLPDGCRHGSWRRACGRSTTSSTSPTTSCSSSVNRCTRTTTPCSAAASSSRGRHDEARRCARSTASTGSFPTARSSSPTGSARPVPPEETLDILRRLQFTAAADGDTLVATPPVVRTDIAIAEDIVEEVGRVAGYDRLPVRVPDGPLPLAERHPLEEFRERARDALVGFGLQEIVAYSLIDPSWLRMLTADGSCIAPDPLRVVNPTTIAQSVARPTLRASMLDTARRNIHNRGSIAIFEISPVYLPRRGDLPEERITAAILLTGNAEPPKDGETWLVRERTWDLHDLDGFVRGLADLLRVEHPRGEVVPAPGLHPGRSTGLSEDGSTRLVSGQLDPRVAERWQLPSATFVAEIDLAWWKRHARPARVAPPSRYPAAIRDIAVVVADATPYAEVERSIR